MILLFEILLPVQGKYCHPDPAKPEPGASPGTSRF
jgi:hypothetical protein